MAGTVTLGVDGRPCVADDPLSGMVGGTPEETAIAANIMEEARRRADDMVARAITESASIRDRAQHAGFEDGYERGAGAARVELASALALVQRVALEGKAVRDDLLRRSEHEIIETVIAALTSILGERVQLDVTVVQETVRRALERAGAQNVVRVRVHPDEVESVTAVSMSVSGAAPAFEFIPDGTIGLGGCIVDTLHGRVDARLDTQLDVIARLLRDALPPATSEEVADAA